LSRQGALPLSFSPPSCPPPPLTQTSFLDTCGDPPISSTGRSAVKPVPPFFFFSFPISFPSPSPFASLSRESLSLKIPPPPRPFLRLNSPADHPPSFPIVFFPPRSFFFQFLLSPLFQEPQTFYMNPWSSGSALRPLPPKSLLNRVSQACLDAFSCYRRGPWLPFFPLLPP